MTVCELYAKQNRHRGNVRHNTTKGRKRLMKLLEADKLGSCPIDSVKLSDAKEWALRMKEKGISYKTISNDKRSLKAAFYTAIQDDCIRKRVGEPQGSEADHRWRLQQFPFPQPGRLPENECELCDHVSGAYEEVQQVP